jgi:hypothetical protein
MKPKIKLQFLRTVWVKYIALLVCFKNHQESIHITSAVVLFMLKF